MPIRDAVAPVASEQSGRAPACLCSMHSATHKRIGATLAMCIALSFAMLAGCHEPDPQATPENSIRAFYAARLATATQGTPSVEQLEQLRPYISTELHSLLQDALLMHHKIASRKTQRGRTFVEGDLFSSLFDGPTSFVTREHEARAADEHVITVRLTSAKQLPALSWTDKVKVVRENGHYVVADIEYTNHWAFGSNSQLVASLRKAMHKSS